MVADKDATRESKKLGKKRIPCKRINHTCQMFHRTQIMADETRDLLIPLYRDIQNRTGTVRDGDARGEEGAIS